ncbi:MAG: GDSL-type esterase/lipase family protein [Armatimonadia bacterium]
MKTYVIPLLVLILAATALAAAPGVPVNLALDRPFISSCSTLPGWHGLVDGEKESDTAPGCYATTNDPSFPKYVVIDLGGDCSISKVVVYNSGNGNTRTVSISSSVDATNYKKLRDPDFIFADRDANTLSVGFQPRTAHYVRITMPDTWKSGLGGDNCMFLREVEVFGVRQGPGDEEPFAFAAGQPAAVKPRVVDVFKRYCLQTPGELKVTVVGDYFVSEADQDSHWARILATELAKLYPNKRVTLTAVGGTEGSIAYAMEWARDSRWALAPDVVVVAYGAQAASVNADLGEFRSKYQGLITELVENTDALVIALTPLPFMQNSSLPLSERTKGRSTRGYAWAVEQVAQTAGLPIVRTASVLAKAPGGKADLYQDNMHLSQEGQLTLGLALADLLR